MGDVVYRFPPYEFSAPAVELEDGTQATWTGHADHEGVRIEFRFLDGDSELKIAESLFIELVRPIDPEALHTLNARRAVAEDAVREQMRTFDPGPQMDEKLRAEIEAYAQEIADSSGPLPDSAFRTLRMLIARDQQKWVTEQIERERRITEDPPWSNEIRAGIAAVFASAKPEKYKPAIHGTRNYWIEYRELRRQ